MRNPAPPVLVLLFALAIPAAARQVPVGGSGSNGMPVGGGGGGGIIVDPDFPSAPVDPDPYDPWGGRLIGQGHLLDLPGSFGRSVAGELTGDHRVDVVTMVGDRPVLSYGPGLYQSFVDFPEAANDVAVLAGGAPSGDDAVAVVSARGLELCWPDLAQGTIVSMSLPRAGWAGAQRVASADLDYSGAADLVGVTADGEGFLLLLDPLGAPVDRLLSVPGTIHDFVLVDWSLGRDIELAAITSQGFYVLDFNGNFLFAEVGGGVAGDRLCTLRYAMLPYDRVACCTQTGTVYHLYVRDRTGTDAPITLGPIGVVGLASTDVDGDGMHDLLISQQATKDLLLFMNLSTGVRTFLWGEGNMYFVFVDDSGPAPTNFALPVVEDLDQDGDPDLFFPVQSLQNVLVIHNTMVAHRDFAPAFIDGRYDYDEDNFRGALSLTFEMPVPDLGDPNAIEVVLWQQDEPAEPTSRESLDHRLIDVPAGSTVVVEFQIEEDIEDYFVHDVEFRQVRLDASGTTILDVGPTHVGAFCTRLSTIQEMTSLYGLPGGGTVILPIAGYSHGTGQGSDIGCGVVPLGGVPGFYDDILPDPK